MTPFEVTSVAGLFVGPVAAAFLTVWAQERQRRLISRQMLVANFLSVHDDPSDVAFSAIVRRVPLEFSNRPKIVKAWNDWKTHLNINLESSSPQGQLDERDRLKLILLRELTNAVGWRFHESDIQNLAYRSQGLMDKINQQNAAQLAILHSLARIADAIDRLAPPTNSETK